jgi:hypothetical protein
MPPCDASGLPLPWGPSVAYVCVTSAVQQVLFLLRTVPCLLCFVVQAGAQAMAVVEGLARRIAATGGAALLVDYGADKPYTNSLTGACASHYSCFGLGPSVTVIG